MQQLERDHAGPAYDEHDLVICYEIGGPIDPPRLPEPFARHRKAAVIPAGSVQVLRHTAATLAADPKRPVPVHVVAGRLGDDPKTVLGTDTHLLPTRDPRCGTTDAPRVDQHG